MQRFDVQRLSSRSRYKICRTAGGDHFNLDVARAFIGEPPLRKRKAARDEGAVRLSCPSAAPGAPILSIYHLTYPNLVGPVLAIAASTRIESADGQLLCHCQLGCVAWRVCAFNLSP